MTDHWFEPLAEHMGEAYLKYSFTMGTENEVAFIVDALGLEPGQRLLDVGCGPGRHAYGFAQRGIEVVGVDISQRFVDLANENAPAGATFVRADARDLPFDAEFDAVISLCQAAKPTFRHCSISLRKPAGVVMVSDYSCHPLRESRPVGRSNQIDPCIE